MYFMLVGPKHVKIGWAVDPVTRMASFQCSNPFTIELLLMVRATSQDAEGFFHRQFEKYHFRNEIFHYEGNLKGFITTKSRRVDLVIERDGWFGEYNSTSQQGKRWRPTGSTLVR